MIIPSFHVGCGASPPLVHDPARQVVLWHIPVFHVLLFSSAADDSRLVGGGCGGCVSGVF